MGITLNSFVEILSSCGGDEEWKEGKDDLLGWSRASPRQLVICHGEAVFPTCLAFLGCG